MKKLFTLLVLIISFSMNAQMVDNSAGVSATGNKSVAMGNGTNAGGSFATAMGSNTTASGWYSTAMAENTTASGASSVSMGYNTESYGYYSTAMGFETKASDFGSLVIGRYNSSGSSVTDRSNFSTSAPAFVIGNGADSSNKSDAFKVMFNGNTTISGDD